MPNTSITLFVFFKLIYRLTDFLKPNFNSKNIPQKQENKSFCACSRYVYCIENTIYTRLKMLKMCRITD